MAAGALAGIAEHSAVYPLDLLKVLQALKDNADRAYGLQTRLQVLNPSPSGLYSGLSNALSRILKAEGIGSLWRGISSVALGAGRILRSFPVLAYRD